MPTSSSLIERLFYYAENNPARDALVSPTVTLSYAQLAKLVTEQVKTFEDKGISGNDVIGINCANDIQHLVLCLAATHIGATSCTIPSHEAKQAQASLSNRCNVTHLADTGIAGSLEAATTKAIATQPPAFGACFLFSTSGTTGEPKLVVHHDSDLVAQAHRHIGSDQERFACLASMEHNFVKRHRLYAVAAGATNVFFDTDGESFVTQSLALAVNVVHVSGFQAQELLATPGIERLDDIRLKLGGSHVPLSLRQQLRDNISDNLQAGYGTTETGAIAFTDPKDSGSGESVGQPLPGINIRVVCPKRKVLGTGERGELAIHCEGMFREYLGKPELTAARLEDGWFYTGDIGYLDKQQRIYLCGRSDDMFVFNSMNIYPQDIESTILQHPNIVDVAVIPKASPVHGNIPVALLVFKNNVKQRLPDIQKFVQKRAGVRSPRQYIIVPEIPKTASGKISRRKAQSLPSKSSEIRCAILSMLKTNSIEHLKPSLISAFKNGDQDIKLNHLEMDSLGRMDFLVSLELEYDTVISPQQFRTFRYLGNIVAHILSPPEPATPQKKSSDEVTKADNAPYIVHFFQRVFRHCRTVAQLNKALTTLEGRLTPLEVESLNNGHRIGQLMPIEAEKKFHAAISRWLQETKNSMLHSGKERPEPFLRHRITRTANYFSGPGSPTNKTLLICFPPKDMRQMGIPNPIFLQHADSKRFDLLIISSPFTTGYRFGKSKFNNKLAEFCSWLTTQSWIQQYPAIRTLGFSAGGRTAITTGNLLKAEMAVSVNGRFHRKRHVFKNLDQLITIWKVGRTGQCLRVLISYTPDNPRDRIFANVIAKISDGKKIKIQHKHEKLKHLIFQQLLDHGELANYLDRSIFAENDDSAFTSERTDFAISFPSGQTHPRNNHPSRES